MFSFTMAMCVCVCVCVHARDTCVYATYGFPTTYGMHAVHFLHDVAYASDTRVVTNTDGAYKVSDARNACEAHDWLDSMRKGRQAGMEEG